MAKLLRHANPDVVHAHWTYEFALAAMASDLPTIVTIRDAPLTVVRHMPTAFRALRATLAYAVRFNQRRARFTAPSPYIANVWHQQMLTKQQIQVIPNFAPAQALKRSAAKSLHPTIIEVADMSPRKNVQLLIEAFQIVKLHIPSAELILVGEGLGATDKLAQNASKHGFSDSIRFLGYQPSEIVHQLMKSSWIHAHVSKEESFGNTIAEAMRSRTAVLAGKDTGAPPWLLADGVAGKLVDIRSAEEVGIALKDMLHDKELLNQYVLNAYDRVGTVFSSEGVIAAYLHEYQSAILNHQESRKSRSRP